jgi:hypothetical protein
MYKVLNFNSTLFKLLYLNKGTRKNIVPHSDFKKRNHFKSKYYRDLCVLTD